MGSENREVNCELNRAQTHNLADPRTTEKKILTSHSRSGFGPFLSQSADGQCPAIVSRTIC